MVSECGVGMNSPVEPPVIRTMDELSSAKDKVVVPLTVNKVAIARMNLRIVFIILRLSG